MKWEKLIRTRKKEHPADASGRKARRKTPACDEAYQLAIETNWAFGMLPAGGFPDCLWYFH